MFSINQSSTLFDDIERDMVEASLKSDNIILLGNFNSPNR